MRVRNLIAGGAITVGSLVSVAAPVGAAADSRPNPGVDNVLVESKDGSQTMAATSSIPPLANYWINLSSRQGSLNCTIEGRQVTNYNWRVRKVSGTCYDMRIETYAYNSYYMTDLDTYSGPVPNGRYFELYAPFGRTICYVYVQWRDSAGVLRDALFMRGGGVG
jgi:hypothetical protein